MKVEKVYYQRNFPISQFIFETIGIGATIDSDDEYEECLNDLKKKVNEYHYINYPDQLGIHIKVINAEKLEIADEEINNRWEGVKEKLHSFEFLEEAQEYLETTEFLYYVLAKAIINSKQSKNK